MTSAAKQVSVLISKDGPYIVSGDAPLTEEIIGTNADGESIKWQRGKSYEAPAKYALCRCGQSANAPFCDGTHARAGFDGTETAPRTPFAAQAQVFDGPDLSLLDARHLCADARFCDPNGKVWNQVARTDDPDVRAMFLSQVHSCPAGRLIAFDKAVGKMVEQHLPFAVGLIEDPVEDCSGPIWLRGGVTLTSSDGHHYEVRNNMTVCRCGASRNKPFCDGSHASIGFRAKQNA
jgi:CDGSH-type Zn-finger protein